MGSSSQGSLRIKQEPMDNKFEIGEYYLVQRSDGSWIPGKILEIRYIAAEKYGKCYVHYAGLDRRLDEWVPWHQIMAEKFYESKPDPDINANDQSGRKVTRYQRRKYFGVNQAHKSYNERTTAALEKERKAITRVKYIDKIQLGKFEINTWYFSPYPDEYGKQSKLFICEFCLKYMKHEESFCYHLGTCTQQQPAGKIVYRNGTEAIYEVDGKDHKLYCQNLCLLGKLFLDHKTIYYDIERFLFYAICRVDEEGAHLAGFFSKEKESSEGNNLACILIFPPYQRHGYGKLLISFSYELSKLEGIVGSPERPFSDLGYMSYLSYWSHALLKVLRLHCHRLRLSDISQATGITRADLITTLQYLNLTQYWKGDHISCLTYDIIEERLDSLKPISTVHRDGIMWTPPNK